MFRSMGSRQQCCSEFSWWCWAHNNGSVCKTS